MNPSFWFTEKLILKLNCIILTDLGPAVTASPDISVLPRIMYKGVCMSRCVSGWIIERWKYACKRFVFIYILHLNLQLHLHIRKQMGFPIKHLISGQSEQSGKWIFEWSNSCWYEHAEF